MRQINVPVEDELYDRCKEAAARAGMFFRIWVARTLKAAAEPGGARESRQEDAAERMYIPLEGE